MTDPTSIPPRAMRWRGTMIAIFLAFAVGLGAMAWVQTHWLASQRADVGNRAAAVTTDATPQAEPKQAPVANSTQPTLPATDPSAEVAPAPPPSLSDPRVGELEARLAEIDRHAAASADQASRAEGLLIAFAARRAIDSGVALGYLESELNSHFGAAQPRAVANIIAASRTPVTLEGLRIALDGVVPEADPSSAKGDWWARLRANFSGLITVRKSGEQTTAPDERIARARLALNTGAVQNALADVARLPGGRTTNLWMGNARRYIEAHQALDLLEAAALVRQQPAKMVTPKPAPAPSGLTGAI